jgi:hypothetical protein
MHVACMLWCAPSARHCQWCWPASGAVPWCWHYSCSMCCAGGPEPGQPAAAGAHHDGAQLGGRQDGAAAGKDAQVQPAPAAAVCGGGVGRARRAQVGRVGVVGSDRACHVAEAVDASDQHLVTPHTIHCGACSNDGLHIHDSWQANGKAAPHVSNCPVLGKASSCINVHHAVHTAGSSQQRPGAWPRSVRSRRATGTPRAAWTPCP